MSPRPTETPPADDVLELRDAGAPDFLERHEVALLAFLDGRDEAATPKMRARLALVAARLARPGFRVGVVDVARDRLVAEALGVKAVPVLMVFAGGEMVDRLMGTPPDGIIEETLRARLR